jgi:hypothetical protein
MKKNIEKHFKYVTLVGINHIHFLPPNTRPAHWDEIFNTLSLKTLKNILNITLVGINHIHFLPPNTRPAHWDEIFNTLSTKLRSLL